MKIDITSLESREVHDLLTSAISPLPIALISTVSHGGIHNAAPFSLVMPISWKPPLICVSIGSKGGVKKDTLKNLEETGDFVVNVMGEPAIGQTIRTAASYPSDVDEIQEVGLRATASETVKAPRIAEAGISIECRLSRVIETGTGEDIRWLVIGEVALVHMKDEVWSSGKIDPTALKAVGRLNNNLYCRTQDQLTLQR